MQGQGEAEHAHTIASTRFAGIGQSSESMAGCGS